MLNRKPLIDLLSRSDLTRKDKIILCLSVNINEPKSIKAIKEIARNAGLREVLKWNLSAILKDSREFAIRTDNGWELTPQGINRVQSLSGDTIGHISLKEPRKLRDDLSKIKSSSTAGFVDEAIRCFEVKAFRAAVILSWIGAISILYDYVVQNNLATFNAEAKLKNPKWKEARTFDDLTRMKEQDFLDVLQSTSIIGKNVKQQLETCLKLRNGCGHPNSLEINENSAAFHLEILILNVFSKF